MFMQQQIKKSLLCRLENGSIQPFQIEEQLRSNGIPSFEIQKLKSEIYETYQKEHPRY